MRSETPRLMRLNTKPPGPWPWTDDTAMALSLYQILSTRGTVRQGDLARALADAYAPLGAWFAADLNLVAREAALSAEVTRARPEAAAGAIAVALAAALAVHGESAEGFVAAAAERTPDSEVASRLRQVTDRPFGLEPTWIAGEVGCGLQVSAQDKLTTSGSHQWQYPGHAGPPSATIDAGERYADRSPRSPSPAELASADLDRGKTLGRLDTLAL